MDKQNLKSKLFAVQGDPAKLEALYRGLSADDERVFCAAMQECAQAQPNNVLFSAWVLRLGDGHGETVMETKERGDEGVSWKATIILSVLLGGLYILFAEGRLPAPVPEVGSWFWLWWAPLLGLMLLALFTIVRKSAAQEIRRYLYAIGGMAGITFLAWMRFTGGHTDATNLMALHLPIVIWAIVGVAYMWKMDFRTLQVFAFVKKSLEVCVTAGLFYAVGGIFTALTAGIFSALGVEIPENFLMRFAAWGMGVVPLLAVASVYDVRRDPRDQDWRGGIARILAIITRLLLPLALLVLVVYVAWFIPTHFWEPFQNREVLTIYNATILAMIVLLGYVPSEEHIDTVWGEWLKHGVLAGTALTILLNIYAYAAVLSRTFAGGITPNRHAVLGWNMVTLIMLSILIVTLICSRKKDDWTNNFQKSFGTVMIFPVAWAVWVLCVSPLI